MKIGCVFCSYSTPQYLRESIRPWIDARKTRLGGHEYLISAVSLPFAGYESAPEDKATPSALRVLLDGGMIDYLITEPRFVPEYDARTLALKPLLAAKCDAIVLWDGDELATTDQLRRILAFLEANPFVQWARFSLRNHVFDVQTYLVEPFQPPRFWRVHAPGGYVLSHFHWDNDATYVLPWCGETARQDQFASITVPPSVAAIRHMSWLSCDASKRKCEYQQSHFGECSYRWDEATNQLRFSEAFYAKRGLPLPEIARIGS